MAKVCNSCGCGIERGRKCDCCRAEARPMSKGARRRCLRGKPEERAPIKR